MENFNLKARGSFCEGYRTGDILVHINVWTPQDLTKEEA